MVNEREAQVGPVFHDAAHHFGAGQRAAVVGDGRAARLLQLGQRGQFLALEPYGGRRHGVEARAVGVAFPRAVEHEARDGGIVVDRPGVGHAHDRAEAAARRRR